MHKFLSKAVDLVIEEDEQSEVIIEQSEDIFERILNAELVKKLADESPLKCVYAGGISSYEDIDLILSCGGDRVDYTVGSALDIFGGHLSYQQLVARQ